MLCRTQIISLSGSRTGTRSEGFRSSHDRVQQRTQAGRNICRSYGSHAQRLCAGCRRAHGRTRVTRISGDSLLKATCRSARRSSQDRGSCTRDDLLYCWCQEMRARRNDAFQLSERGRRLHCLMPNHRSAHNGKYRRKDHCRGFLDSIAPLLPAVMAAFSSTLVRAALSPARE